MAWAFPFHSLQVNDGIKLSNRPRPFSCPSHTFQHALSFTPPEELVDLTKFPAQSRLSTHLKILEQYSNHDRFHLGNLFLSYPHDTAFVSPRNHVILKYISYSRRTPRIQDTSQRATERPPGELIGNLMWMLKAVRISAIINHIYSGSERKLLLGPYKSR